MILHECRWILARSAGHLRFALCCGLLACAGAASGADSGSLREYQIKAAFLFNFTRFVEWPESSFADAGSPIVIGVYCDRPFARVLEEAVKGRTVNGRAIAVTALETSESARKVHLVFICAAQDARFAGIKSAMDGRPVLAVGETDEFAALSGMIQFKLVDDKVRFEINMAAVERVGLRVSSQLQKLATAVRRDP